jgi:glycogen debranching enzyme
MHEFSQSADLVDWKATPYFYAAADATPLLIMTMGDYLRASGDIEYIRRNWDSIQRAWAFTRAHDSDGDGIYENTEGTGWVESWPPGMPHQESYLAALDRQSSTAMAALATAMNDPALATAATRQADLIASRIESEYYNATRDAYAFSRNPDGSLDSASTIFPSIAWWDGTYSLAHAAGSLRRWASAQFSTDWGLRDLSPETSFYDPISYHQGSVWPLYTGWESLAQYRGGNPLAGYASLMHNAAQTFTQDAGHVTELLSGEFFQPFGRSSPHQLWSSAMVITPAVRGLFGITEDAARNTLHLSPQLPASWNEAELVNFRMGKSRFDLHMARAGGQLEITLRPREAAPPCLTSPAQIRPVPCGASSLQVSLPAVEVEQPTGLPLPGAATSQAKVLSRTIAAKELTVEMAGPGGATVELKYRFNQPGVSVEGATILNDRIRAVFPNGAGYQRKVLTFRW